MEKNQLLDLLIKLDLIAIGIVLILIGLVILGIL